MKKMDIVFDGACRDYLMRNNGFACGINMPKALEGDMTFGLPPYAKRVPFLVDKYPACPKNWMRSKGKVKSYFVPVLEGRGMWLDLNENDCNSHHVAIVISVQGVNPITGMPCEDAQMEQYVEECPKHKIKFGPDRYCKKCDYKWPKQNYLTTTSTPDGMLWLDGFRSIDGIVRQYILTAEKMKGVASNIIGKEKVVYAIGFSFFTSKEKKPKPTFDANILRSVNITTNNVYGSPMFFSPTHTPTNWQYKTMSSCSCSFSSAPTIGASLGQIKGASMARKSGGLIPKYHCVNSSSVTPIKTKKLEVVAGAKINQQIYNDNENLEYWHDKPESIICVSYATEEDCRRIINGGEIDIEGHEEGFLQKIPVGN